MIIYKITNTVTGKIYIGQTRQPLKKRWMQHCYSRCNSRGLLGAIQKYGRDKFNLEVLFEAVSKEQLNEQEKFFIASYGCMVPNGYNLTSGGEGSYVRSEETRRLLSEAGKRIDGRPHTAETKAKMSAAKKGRNRNSLSNEHRQKLSLALLGRLRPQEVKDKIRANHNPISDLNLTHRRKPALEEQKTFCKDCGTETKPGTGSARCVDCWEDRCDY